MKCTNTVSKTIIQRRTQLYFWMLIAGLLLLLLLCLMQTPSMRNWNEIFRRRCKFEALNLSITFLKYILKLWNLLEYCVISQNLQNHMFFFTSRLED